MLHTSNLRRLFVVACSAVAWGLVTANPVIGQLNFEGAVYHEATNTGRDSGTPDQGGAIFFFVRNSGTTPQTFTSGNVLLNNAAASSYADHDWTRVWPLTIQPGEVATLTMKGRGGVFAPGQNVDIRLTSDTGTMITQNNIPLTTPKLRVANVVPSQDLTKSYVYLRNDDTSSYSVNDLFLNDNVTSSSRFVGGSNVIAPQSLKIIEVDHGQAQDLITPYAVRVAATRQSDSQSVLTGAPVRLTEPILPTGSWQAGLHEQETQMEEARLQYGHQIHGATSRFPRLMDSRLEKYSIRGVNIDVLDFVRNGNQYDINTVEYRDFTTGVTGGVPYQSPVFELPGPVADQADNPAIYAWYLRDEPDLNTSAVHRNPQAMWRLNETYWRNSPKATFINLVSDNNVQRYGLIADHPAIDRYMQSAPLAGSAGNRNIDQVLQYADSMKNNVEPLRMWWVTQGVSEGTWSSQPTDWGIDVQFWSAIMGGAKGMVGFMWEDVEANYPVQQARQEALTRELQSVRSLILYGEPLANTTLSVGGVPVNQSATDIDAAARSIISEHAVVLPVANLTGRQTFSFTTPQFDVLNNVAVDLTIPDWISIDQVRRVTKDGYLDDVSFTRNGQDLTISIDSLIDTEVFLISENDALPPAQVNDLHQRPGTPAIQITSRLRPTANFCPGTSLLITLASWVTRCMRTALYWGKFPHPLTSCSTTIPPTATKFVRSMRLSISVHSALI